MSVSNGPSYFQVAGLGVAQSGARTIEAFESVDGKVGRARLEAWRCHNDAGLDLVLAYITPQVGSREVRCTERHGSPTHFDAIVNRLRLTINSEDTSTEWVMLKLAQPKEGGVRARFNLHGADWSLLRTVTGLDVRGTLSELGAREYSPPDRERASVAPSVAFAAGDRRVPMAVFVCTRVLPLLRS